MKLAVCLCAVFFGSTLRAEVCDAAHQLEGSYGFQLLGKTKISGDAKPVVSLGRITFNSDGSVSGSSSVMFAGFLLGDPVTGRSELQGDCTISLSLQDDSGAFQKFTGTITADRKIARFRQTDVGAVSGIMARTANQCAINDLRKRYDFTLSGSFTPMADSQEPASVTAEGSIQRDDSGNFKLVVPAVNTEVKIHLEDDCIVSMELFLPTGSGSRTTLVTLRGVLVNEGSEILAIRTDPGWIAPARFTAH